MANWKPNIHKLCKTVKGWHHSLLVLFQGCLGWGEVNVEAFYVYHALYCLRLPSFFMVASSKHMHLHRLLQCLLPLSLATTGHFQTCQLLNIFHPVREAGQGQRQTGLDAGSGVFLHPVMDIDCAEASNTSLKSTP